MSPAILDNLQALVRDLEDIKTKKDQATGRANRIKDEIRKKFGVKSASEAKAVRDKIHKQAMKTTKEYQAAQQRFQQELNKVKEKGDA